MFQREATVCICTEYFNTSELDPNQVLQAFLHIQMAGVDECLKVIYFSLLSV